MFKKIRKWWWERRMKALEPTGKISWESFEDALRGMDDRMSEPNMGERKVYEPTRKESHALYEHWKRKNGLTSKS